jgi:hypothetical protein
VTEVEQMPASCRKSAALAGDGLLSSCVRQHSRCQQTSAAQQSLLFLHMLSFCVFQQLWQSPAPATLPLTCCGAVAALICACCSTVLLWPAGPEDPRLIVWPGKCYG